MTNMTSKEVLENILVELESIRVRIEWYIHPMIQKSKKTRKKQVLVTCALKVLYATKKYGCSGIEGYIECSKCEFRR